jgi:hypothetical protein
MWAMMDGAIPANRLKSKPPSWSAAARVRCLKPPDAPGGFQPYVMRDRDFIATSDFRRI